MDFKKELTNKLLSFKRYGNENPLIMVGINIKSDFINTAWSVIDEQSDKSVFVYSVPVKYTAEEPDAFYVTSQDGSPVKTSHFGSILH